MTVLGKGVSTPGRHMPVLRQWVTPHSISSLSKSLECFPARLSWFHARFLETELGPFQTSGLGTAHIQIWPCAPIFILHSYYSVHSGILSIWQPDSVP